MTMTRNNGQFAAGNTLGAVHRQRREVRSMLPGLRELAADTAIPYRWRRRLRTAAQTLETAPAATLGDSMIAVAGLLRRMADDLDSGSED